MSAFRFRLGSVERLRRQVREQCQTHVAEAEAAWHRLAAERNSVERRLAMLQDGVRSSVGPGRLDLARLSSSRDFGDHLRAQLQELSQRQVRLEEAVVQRRLELVEADRELKTLEKLRQRQHEQHQAAEQRADQKLLDDAASRANVSNGAV